MKLADLLSGVDCVCVSGSTDIDISGIAYDSRKVRPGCVFFCISGAVTDGHMYAAGAAEAGAAAIIAEKPLALPEGVTRITVKSSRKALAAASSVFFGNPKSRLRLIGVTGTKGKTSTSYMIREIMEAAGISCGLIGTMGAFYGDKKIKTGLTTPESYVIHSLLKEMADAGCKYVVMEVSSQALMLERTFGLRFDTAIFMNFSPDHIGKGEHSSLEEYKQCKELLFKQADTGIFNADDEACGDFLRASECKRNYTFGAKEGADLRMGGVKRWSGGGTLGISYGISGMVSGEAVLEIPGGFNAYNSLAAIFAAALAGIGMETMLAALRHVRIPGRVELVPVSDSFSVIIDYAHNAVSTRSVLATLREYGPARIICVYGAGGNRSKLRRYDMGEAAAELADFSVLTCDNPRDEEVCDINNDIKKGLAKHGGRYAEIEDRVEAIAYAMKLAGKGDIILLLGKGHEDYMEIKGVKYPYSEKEAVFKAYGMAKGSGQP